MTPRHRRQGHRPILAQWIANSNKALQAIPVSRQSEWTVKLMVKVGKERELGCTRVIGDDHLAFVVSVARIGRVMTKT